MNDNLEAGEYNPHELIFGAVEALAQMAAAIMASGVCKPEVLLAFMNGCLEGQAKVAQTAHVPSRQLAAGYVAELAKAVIARDILRRGGGRDRERHTEAGPVGSAALN